MLSILIPVYNFDVRSLVADLCGQCMACGVGFEVICFDDGSTALFKHINREVQKHNHVIYNELPQNLGRSAIRNALGNAAQFPYLLFMDCDSKVVRADFIKKYVDHVSPEKLVYGGRCYEEKPPLDKALFFHWKYGKEREQTTPEQRRKSPYHSFMTNNFLIPKVIFLAIGFDESLKQYGHEDTLFGMELSSRNIPIEHIDNPLEHSGLEPVDVFLKKTRQGLENLHYLVGKGAPVETRLLVVYEKIKKWNMAGPLRFVFQLLKPFVLKNLASEKPDLRLFDFYKLGYFASLSQKQGGGTLPW